MTIQTMLLRGTQMLRAAGIADAAGDARRLMAACLGVDRGRLTLHLHDECEAASEAAFLALVEKRAAGAPVSHLLGYRDFYGRRFHVSSDVLDPRPDTETLVEAALAVPFDEVLDLGTGSGCILLTLLAERAGATGIGTDLSAAALTVAQINAGALDVTGRCSLLESDWFAAVGGQYDLIVSNPPYIAADEMLALAPELAHEPRGALTDEGDGLGAYRVIVPGASAHLRSGGWLMVEIGWQQGPAVQGLFQQAGFGQVAVLPDIDGRDRVVQGQWSG